MNISIDSTEPKSRLTKEEERALEESKKPKKKGLIISLDTFKQMIDAMIYGNETPQIEDKVEDIKESNKNL